jgi:hypothetical protein
MKVAAIIFLLALPVFAQDRAGAKICGAIVTKGELEKEMNADETKVYASCLNEVGAGMKKCEDAFDLATKSATTKTKNGMLKILEESKMASTCSTDLSIRVVQKYFR